MDKNQALSKAMALCSKKEYCEADIREKLKFWEISPEDADLIIRQLVKEKFIDDLRFTMAYARDKVRLNKWGRIKIRYMLSMIVTDHSIVDRALAEIDEEFYADALQDLLRKKFRLLKSESDPFSKRQKLIRFAQGRGFEIDLIIKQIKDLT